MARKYSSTFERHFSYRIFPLQWKSQAEMNAAWEFSSYLQGDGIIELDKQTTVVMKVKNWMDEIMLEELGENWPTTGLDIIYFETVLRRNVWGPSKNPFRHG